MWIYREKKHWLLVTSTYQCMHSLCESSQQSWLCLLYILIGHPQWWGDWSGQRGHLEESIFHEQASATEGALQEAENELKLPPASPTSRPGQPSKTVSFNHFPHRRLLAFPFVKFVHSPPTVLIEFWWLPSLMTTSSIPNITYPPPPSISFY